MNLVKSFRVAFSKNTCERMFVNTRVINEGRKTKSDELSKTKMMKQTKKSLVYREKSTSYDKHDFLITVL